MHAGTGWDSIVEQVWKNMGGIKMIKMSIGECGGYKTKARDMAERSRKEALRQKAHEGEHLEILEGLREGIGMKLYLHGPMHNVQKFKVPFRVKGGDAQKFPCGKAI